MDFDQRVDAIIAAVADDRARQSGAIGGRRNTGRMAAHAYLQQVAPMGAEAFSALARIGLPIRNGDLAAHDRRADYIELSPHGTSRNPSAWSSGNRFLSSVKYLHASGLLLDRQHLLYRDGEAEDYVRGGGLGEPPIRPPKGMRPNSGGSYIWYSEPDLQQEFVRAYRSISGGPLRELAGSTPQQRPCYDGKGFIHVDFDSNTVYLVWDHEGGTAAQGTIGDMISAELRVETLHAYLTRLVAHESALHQHRSGR